MHPLHVDVSLAVFKETFGGVQAFIAQDFHALREKVDLVLRPLVAVVLILNLRILDDLWRWLESK